MARPPRVISFFRADDRLHRTVVMNDGRTYAQTCTLEVFKQVAHALQETPRPTTLMVVAQEEQLPYTQVHVAIEFLKDRGLLEIVRRRCVPASRTFFEDAMTEFFALPDQTYQD